MAERRRPEAPPRATGPWRTAWFAAANAPVADVVGERTATEFAALRVGTVGDLVRTVPRRWFRGTELSDLAALVPGESVAVLARVTGSVIRGQAPRQRLIVTVTDGGASLDVVFFGRQHLLQHWQRELTEGARAILAGKVGEYRGTLQLSHPDFVVLAEDGSVTGGAKRNEGLATVARGEVVALYRQTAKLPTWTIAECIALGLEAVRPVADPLPEALRAAVRLLDPETGAARELLTLDAALTALHAPADLQQARDARQRIIFDEALGVQLVMAARRRRARAEGSRAIAAPRPGGLLARLDERLPFALTEGQRRVGEEIAADLAGPAPMQRLLQGEVGTGKTLVALRAMAAVVESGAQAALLAPTEVLAAQHAASLTETLGELARGGELGAPEGATRVELLTGSMPAARRRATLLRIASGEAGVVVGTHALLADRVQWADLGLVVVDEQHRFGVEQRARLTDAADVRPHTLVMTATPIPRSVAMTVFGDLDVSTLTEVPAGRADVTTVLVEETRQPAWVARAWQRIGEEVVAGRQAYVVCPTVTPSAADAEDAHAPRSVTGLAEELRAALPDVRVGVLHGQLASAEKEATMAAFAAGELDVLVATTVIEVGVDVANATVMVVSDADRFGISQLHQLRGRIGRGSHEGLCLLLTRTEAPEALERLRAVAATRDGFALAEVDLAQRREGDVLGASQSGRRSSLRWLSALDDLDVIAAARRVAEDALGEGEAPAEPGLVDMITEVEQRALGEWLERT